MGPPAWFFCRVALDVPSSFQNQLVSFYRKPGGVRIGGRGVRTSVWRQLLPSTESSRPQLPLLRRPLSSLPCGLQSTGITRFIVFIPESCVF